MNIYLLTRKIIQAFALVVIMTLIIFVVFRLMPGNPGLLLLKSANKTGTPLSTKQKEAILSTLGLQDGKFSLVDFETYLYQMFTFHWGKDFNSPGQYVYNEIANALPYTLVLIVSSALLSFAIGIPLGIVVSKMRGGKKEGVLLTTSLILNSIPYFILGVILFLYLAVYSSVLPLKSSVPLTYITHPSLSTFPILLYHIALPFSTLLIIESMGHMITMRAAMVSTLGEDHITTARAKGVPEKSILRKHAARIAVIPVTTRLALQLSFLISGSLIVAIIFNWPGMGPLLYHAVLNEDYPLSEASTFIISLLTIVAYSLIDYIHAWLDPRIKV
ncbi:MAG: ABC transporter permease [Candidatus Thermoplasmatota archaeon]|nr:ABC transporter permease [Candidatus Thermoplasmatota archaeon]